MGEYLRNAYGVYVFTDESGRITAINSDTFLPSLDGWTRIDEGYGDKYHHAQGNYFDKPIMDDRGIWRYKLENDIPMERTQEEMDADYIPPAPAPDNNQRIADLEAAIAALEEGIASV